MADPGGGGRGQVVADPVVVLPAAKVWWSPRRWRGGAVTKAVGAAV